MGLGYLYDAGVGVAANPAESLRWYRRAAEAGMIDAQLHMAHAALRRRDEEGQREAIHWLAKAAAQDSAEAMNDYAWLLATSKHAELRDGARAVSLARHAVDTGAERKPPRYSGRGLCGVRPVRAGGGDAARGDCGRTGGPPADGPAEKRALIEELTTHLREFEAGKPWRE